MPIDVSCGMDYSNFVRCGSTRNDHSAPKARAQTRKGLCCHTDESGDLRGLFSSRAGWCAGLMRDDSGPNEKRYCGKGSVTPHRWVAKLAPMTRTAGGAYLGRTGYVEGNLARLGAP